MKKSTGCSQRNSVKSHSKLLSVYTDFAEGLSRIPPLVLASSRHPATFRIFIPIPPCKSPKGQLLFKNPAFRYQLKPIPHRNRSRQAILIPHLALNISRIPHPASRLHFVPHPASRQTYVGPSLLRLTFCKWVRFPHFRFIKIIFCLSISLSGRI